jgi:DNA-binding MurR/RpiR family transcriptional regulator
LRTPQKPLILNAVKHPYRIREIAVQAGLSEATVDRVLHRRGGNAAVVDAFAQLHRRYDVFVAHDLDGENTALLRSRKLSAVLHHDLRQDLRRACHVILQAQRALPGPVRTNPSAISVITPFNAPPVEF